MDDPIKYIKLANAEIVLNISVSAIFVAILVLQLLVRRGSVKFHYYFLLAANVFALISNAINVGFYNTYIDSNGPVLALIILGYMSDAFFGLTAVLTLRQFTASYLGGPTFVITVMCSLAIAACLAIIIVAGLYAQSIVTLSTSNHVNTLYSADLWTFFALWVWLLLLLLVIRITYHTKVPHNENRSTIIKTFCLLSLYIIMMFAFYLYVIITTSVAKIVLAQDFGIVVGNVILNILLYRGSTLLFVMFYNKLSVMTPLPLGRDTHEICEV
ncbi:hypothetical protein K450DRAFT_237436, partial [Umbelopsis ramanniana AG]